MDGFSSPTPKSYWEEVFAEPDPWRYFSSPYERNKYRRQIALISDRLLPQRIFEIGCAEGAHTLLLAEAFPKAQITAIDHSKRAISRARKNLKHLDSRVEVFENDVLTYLQNIPVVQWDLIVWSESLRHFGRNLSAFGLSCLFKSIALHLALGGILCMANKVEEINSDESLDRRPLMEAYFSLLSHHLRPVSRSVYIDQKDESPKLYEYEIWLFQHQSTEVRENP